MAHGGGGVDPSLEEVLMTDWGGASAPSWTGQRLPPPGPGPRKPASKPLGRDLTKDPEGNPNLPREPPVAFNKRSWNSGTHHSPFSKPPLLLSLSSQMVGTKATQDCREEGHVFHYSYYIFRRQVPQVLLEELGTVERSSYKSRDLQSLPPKSRYKIARSQDS